MIKINNKDSLIDIINKIENSKDEKIVLVFPIANIILHNYSSLKLLKNKTWNKKLIIITNDLNAKKIWKRLWIKYSILNDKSTLKNIDLLEYNYSFGEYFSFLLRSYFKEFKNLFFKKSNNKLIKYYRNKKNEKSNIWFFVIWLFLSIILLLFIFYFAVNKTYITITPEITIKYRAKNFVFKENINDSFTNENEIKLKKISKIVYLEETFWTHWIKDDNNLKSHWKVIVYNNLAEDLDLLNNSRLQTSSWILFTINWWIKIPKATKQKNWDIIPWKIEANIVSKNYDNKWVFIWKKANIWTWVTLTFPGLKDMSNFVYAKSINVFTWWNDDSTKIVWKNDLSNAKELFDKKIKDYALKELKKQIKEENQTNNITYEILWINKIINYSNLEIKETEIIKVWEERKNFKLNWTVQINTYIFNKELVINKLKSTIRDLLLEDIEKINYIDSNTLRLSNIIYQNKNPFEAKITTEIEVRYTLNFLSKINNYLDKLKNNITWMNKEQAQKILLNNSNIRDVKIETRPFFLKNISNISKNIIFKIKEN